MAWTNPAFAAESSGLTETQCLPCHAPTPLLEQPPKQPLVLRERERGFGVDCVVCHLDGCQYVGPYDSWGPHPMRQETARLKSAEFCGECHLMEHQEYTALYLPAMEAGHTTPKTCAECHMPACRSRLTQGHVLSLIHPRRTVRDHSFQLWTDRLIQGAVELIDLEVHRKSPEEFKASFTLVNRSAGHRIPTGKFGERELRLQVELLDEGGRVLGSGSRSCFSARTQGLAPEKPTTFSVVVAIPGGQQPAAVRLVVERVNRDRSFRRTFLTAQRPVAQDGQADLGPAPMP